MTNDGRLDERDYRHLAIAFAGALINLGVTQIEQSEAELQEIEELGEEGLGNIGLTVEFDTIKRTRTIGLSGTPRTTATQLTFKRREVFGQA